MAILTEAAHRKDGAANAERHSATIKRRDIQGLRALAVVAVVVDHLTNHPQGGFIGVDVFFVISGFLITQVLLRRITAETGIAAYICEFYARRVRRLLPAALTVTVATVVVAYFLFTSFRFSGVRTDAIWATLLLANWHFIAIGTNYFAANSAQSPFQHYWSLSLEEQFYLVWPITLFAATAAARKVVHGEEAKRHAAAGALAALVLIAVSLPIAFAQSASSPIGAYFSTFTRAWELGLGALMASVCILRRPENHHIATALSWVGTAGIAVAAFVVSQGRGFPAPGALLPCLATAVVLWAGSGETSPWQPFLTNEGAVWIGDLSYSIYLVHFPVIIFLEEQMPGKGVYFYITAVTMSLGAAMVLYYGVERPVLDSKSLRRRLAHARRANHFAAPKIQTLTLSVGAAVLFLSTAIYTTWPGDASVYGEELNTIDAALAATVKSPALLRLDPVPAKLQRQIREALKAAKYPPLRPSIDQELQRTEAPSSLMPCGFIQLQSASRCTFGPSKASKTMYVVGDSTAMTYAEAYFEVALHTPGWKVQIGAAFGCNFDTVVIQNSDAALQTGCAAHNAAVVANIRETRPTLVLVTNTYASRVPVGTASPMTDSEWTAALYGELRQIDTSSHVVLVEPAPQGSDPASCYGPRLPPVACAYQVPPGQVSRAAAEEKLAAQHGWTYVDTEGLFCDLATSYCPIFEGDTPIKHDDVHVAYAYDDQMWPVMAILLRSAGVEASGAR